MKHFGQKRYTEGNGKFVTIIMTRLLDYQWHAKGNRPTKRCVVIRGNSDDAKYVNTVESWDETTYLDLTEKIKVSNPELFNEGKIIEAKKLPNKPERVKVAKDYFRDKEKTIEQFDSFEKAEVAYITYSLDDCGKARTRWTINNYINGIDTEEKE